MDRTIRQDLCEGLHSCLRTQHDSNLSTADSRPAAMLVLLYKHRLVCHVLFTQRTGTVEEHKGQVAFPGRGADDRDQGPVETVLRDTEEEIGLRRLDVTVLGALDETTTVTNGRVRPIVGTFPYPCRFRVKLSEAAAVFGVPLKWLAEPANL